MKKLKTECRHMPACVDRSWGYGFGFGLIAAALFSFGVETAFPTQDLIVVSQALPVQPVGCTTGCTDKGIPSSSVSAPTVGGASDTVSVEPPAPVLSAPVSGVAEPAVVAAHERGEESDAAPKPDDALPVNSPEEIAESDAAPEDDTGPKSDHADHSESPTEKKDAAKHSPDSKSASAGRVSDEDINRAIVALFPVSPVTANRESAAGRAAKPDNGATTMRHAAPKQPVAEKPSTKKSPLTGWSLSALSGDRAVLTSASGDSRVVRVGDTIGAAKILKIDSRSAQVETSKGVLTASAH